MDNNPFRKLSMSRVEPPSPPPGPLTWFDRGVAEDPAERSTALPNSEPVNDTASYEIIDPPAYRNGYRRYASSADDPRPPSRSSLHRTFVEKKQKPEMRRAIPVEVLHIIASTSSPSTLGTLSRLNKESYGIIIPYLYYSIPFTRSTARSILWGIELKENKYRFKFVPEGEKRVEPDEHTRERKKKALSFVREIRMDDALVDVQLCESLNTSAAEAEAKVKRQLGEENIWAGSHSLGMGIEGRSVDKLPKKQKEDNSKKGKEKDTGLMGLFRKSGSVSKASNSGFATSSINEKSSAPMEEPPPYDPLPQISSFPGQPNPRPSDIEPSPSLSPPANASSGPLCPNATRLIISPDTLNALIPWYRNWEKCHKHVFDQSRATIPKFHPIHTALAHLIKPHVLEINKDDSGHGILHSLQYYKEPNSFPEAIRVSKDLIAIIQDLIIKLEPNKLIWHSAINEDFPVLVGDQTEFEIHFTRFSKDIDMSISDRVNFDSRLRTIRGMLKDINPPMLPARITIIGIGTERQDNDDIKEVNMQENLRDRLLHPAAVPFINIPLFEAPAIPKAVLDKIEWVNSVEARDQGFGQNCACYRSNFSRLRYRIAQTSRIAPARCDGVRSGRWNRVSKEMEWD